MTSTGSIIYNSFCCPTVDYAQHFIILLPSYIASVEYDSVTSVKLTDKYGRCWEVRLQKLYGRDFLTDGWTTFAGDACLKSSEWMVFTEVSISTFLVEIYDSQLIERNVVTNSSCGFPVQVEKHKSFCKFLSEEFHTNSLVIPQNFVGKNVHITYLRAVRLESIDRTHVSEMKIQQIDGNYYMTDGWNRFKADNLLTKFDILKFEMQADLDRWEVWAYDAFGSAKLTCSGDLEPVGKSEFMQEWRTNHKLFFRWQFVREMTHNTISGKLEIPKKFAQTTVLIAKSYVELRKANGNIELENARYQVKCRKNERLFMYLGWQKFVRTNNVQIGDVLLFTYIPDSNNVIEVHFLDETKGRNMITRAEKGGWLP